MEAEREYTKWLNNKVYGWCLKRCWIMHPQPDETRGERAKYNHEPSSYPERVEWVMLIPRSTFTYPTNQGEAEYCYPTPQTNHIRCFTKAPWSARVLTIMDGARVFSTTKWQTCVYSTSFALLLYWKLYVKAICP